VRSHTVKKGETLTAIARQSGVSVKQLAAANGIPASHRVRAGQRLRIPD
jgi:LysM repeat protein